MIKLVEVHRGTAFMGVQFQVENLSGTEFRLDWNRVALTYPDGAVRNPTRPPGDTPTLSVAPGDTQASTILFAHNLDDPYSGIFLPGGYAVHYDGSVVVGTFFCQGPNCRIDPMPESGRGSSGGGL